jgi:hypothetical protein
VKPILCLPSGKCNLLPPDKLRDLLRREADDYAERLAWCVIAIRRGTKVSLGGWKRYQLRRPSRKVRQDWFKRRDVGGLAVIHGPVSGGLAVRDFDRRSAYQRWAQRHPDLARTLPTAETYRGRHVYFLLAHEVYLELEDGELRGDRGHYTLLPPSAHPEGVYYRWVIPPRLPLALLTPQDFDLSEPQYPSRREGYSTACVNQAILALPNVAGNSWLESVIRMTLPRGPGERNRRLFDFARHLKACPELADADAESLLLVVERWFGQALPHVRTKDFATTWKDFALAWQNVRRPAAGVTLAGVGAYVFGLVRPPDPWAVVEAQEDANLLRLELMCEELQRRHGERPFPLACRVAGDFLGISHMTANRLLNHLRSVGVLRLASEGDRLKKRAREWYCPGVLGQRKT